MKTDTLSPAERRHSQALVADISEVLVADISEVLTDGLLFRDCEVR